MKNNENQYYIYIRSTRERVPVTKEEFDNYYRDISAYRMKQMRHGKCVCPQSKILECDMDCSFCPFRRAGDTLSLDYIVSDEEGNEMAWIDALKDPSPLVADIVADSLHIKELLERLNELVPQAIVIGELRQMGYTERQIEEAIGVGRKTYAYRLKKAKEILEIEFPEFF